MATKKTSAGRGRRRTGARRPKRAPRALKRTRRGETYLWASPVSRRAAPTLL